MRSALESVVAVVESGTELEGPAARAVERAQLALERERVVGDGLGSEAGLSENRLVTELLERGNGIWAELTAPRRHEDVLRTLRTLTPDDLRAAILSRLWLSALLPPEVLAEWWDELRGADAPQANSPS